VAEHVLEFAHVARPAVPRHFFLEGGRQSERLPIELDLQPRQDVFGQEREILDPLAQRRHRNRDMVQPVIEIFAELLLPHRLGQRPVRGGDDPHIDRQRMIAADAGNFPLLNGAQQGDLPARAEIGDLGRGTAFRLAPVRIFPVGGDRRR